MPRPDLGRPSSYLSRASLARELDISESTVDEMVRDECLPPPIVNGRKKVWSWAAVERAIETNRWGTIYFLRCGRHVKIGYTAGDLATRITAIQTGAPEKLEVLASIDGMFRTERKLHQRFARHHSHGEWFHLAPEIQAYVEGLKAGNSI